MAALQRGASMLRMAIVLVMVSGLAGPAAAQRPDGPVCPVDEDWRAGSAACPCRTGWTPTAEQLARMLAAHRVWLDRGGRNDPAVPGRAVLCNADLGGARLERAMLGGAWLEGARLLYATLSGANLDGANLKGADLRAANLTYARFALADLTDADLGGATLDGAYLESAIVTNARLAFASLRNAVYAPASPPPDGYVERIEGLATVRLPPGKHSGLVQLRELVRGAGLRDLEREATFAIEHNRARDARRLGTLSDRTGGWLKLVFFEWTTGWGLHPERALLILLVLMAGLTVVYAVPIALARHVGAAHGIYRVWPGGRLDPAADATGVAHGARAERLMAGVAAAIGWAFYFSMLSAFHIGWRDLNAGAWLTRMQFTDFVLHARGWFRFVSGLQSLISVYLVAIWALTQFGRPFQ